MLLNHFILMNNRRKYNRMQNTIIYLVVILSCVGLISCNEQPSFPQEPAFFISEMRSNLSISREKVRNIYALAECKSPGGHFTTAVYSDMDGNTRFEQKGEGYQIMSYVWEGEGYQKDLLSKDSSEVSDIMKTFLTGHEVHQLAIAPESRFSNPGKKVIDTSGYYRLTLMDMKSSPVYLFYEKENLLPVKMQLENHTGRGEKVVTTEWKNWKVIENCKLPTEVLFIQGKDTFFYNFIDIKLNELKREEFIDTEPVL